MSLTEQKRMVRTEILRRAALLQQMGREREKIDEQRRRINAELDDLTAAVETQRNAIQLTKIERWLIRAWGYD